MGNGTTFIAVGDQQNDADFIGRTKQLHDSILKVGLTDVSASGAITSGSDSSAFDALTRPAANNSAGFQIYGFGDALQSTFPVFIKIEFGSGAGSNWPQLRATVGVAVTSASVGALESNVTSSAPFTERETLQANPTTELHRYYVGGDTNYLTFTGPTMKVANQQHLDGANSWFFACERTKNSVGDDTAEGILIGMNTQATAYTWYSLPASGSVPGNDTEFPTAIGTQNPATNRGRQTISPVFPRFAVSPNPGRNLLSCQNSNFRDLDVIPIAIYSGKVATYIKLSSNVANTVANQSNGHILLRWT